MLSHELKAKKQGFQYIIGIDEAGRGPLAGPVIAAAILPKTFFFKSKIQDSKKLTHLQREKAYEEILKKCYVGVGYCNAKTIDRINILQGTFKAMELAVRNLIDRIPEKKKKAKSFTKKVILLIDGNRFSTKLPYSFETIVKGDACSITIAGASIIAKVTRDRLMLKAAKRYPHYGFEKHKGYPTKFHREQIKLFGFSPIHRKTFHVG